MLKKKETKQKKKRKERNRHIISAVTALIYILTRSVKEFPLLHILINTCDSVFLIIAILKEMSWYLFVVLIFISPMANDTGTFSLWLWSFIQVLCPLFNWDDWGFLVFFSFWYFVNINPSLLIFSLDSVRYLFTLFPLLGSSFWVWYNPFYLSLLLLPMLLGSYPRSHHLALDFFWSWKTSI